MYFQVHSGSSAPAVPATQPLATFLKQLLTVFLFWLFTTPPAGADGIVILQIRTQDIIAEVAATPAERERGLMARPRLAENHGMLFVFPKPGRYAMWMKNTPLPLSAAFIDEEGTIVDIAEMLPLTLTEHMPRRPVKYVLEMNRQWFRSHGVRVGDRITGLRQAGAGS